MKRYLLLVFVIVLAGFANNILAQPCPPVITPSNNGDSNTIISGNDVSKCPDASVLMVAAPSSGVTYEWYRNGVKIDTATHGAILSQDPGDYSVVVSGCPLSSNVIHIVNFVLPEAFITFSDNPVCSGETIDVDLTANPNLSNYTWLWVAPIGYLGSTTNPISDNFSLTTTFTAVLTTDDGCAKTKSETLVVHQPIDPGQIIADQTICSGSAPNLLNGPPATGGDGNYSYQWQYSTNTGTTWINIGGATGLSYQPNSLTQTTWYRRVVFTSPPCPAVTQYNPVIVTVNNNPVITSPTTISICSGESVNYTPISNVNGTTFAWTGVNTSGNVTGISPSGTGGINDFSFNSDRSSFRCCYLYIYTHRSSTNILSWNTNFFNC